MLENLLCPNIGAAANPANTIVAVNLSFTSVSFPSSCSLSLAVTNSPFKRQGDAQRRRWTVVLYRLCMVWSSTYARATMLSCTHAQNEAEIEHEEEDRTGV
jgi:hypothetical protein